MMATDPLVKRSKHLSLVLRHDPGSVGLTLDGAGWADVEKLLSAMKLTMAELEDVVENNNKKRFEFNGDKTKIRASQGHSVEVELGYEEKTPPARLFHGTSRGVLEAIFTSGISKMERHHVHLSADRDTALKVAQRRKDPIVLVVLATEMNLAGYKFYQSTNGVWLTDSVPSQYLEALK
jgi:putative RNA 2'-phosphotransferase